MLNVSIRGDRKPVMGKKRLALTIGILLWARKAAVKDKQGEGGIKLRERKAGVRVD